VMDGEYYVSRTLRSNTIGDLVYFLCWKLPYSQMLVTYKDCVLGFCVQEL
ncbi:hypothetical protein DBR06_SOUSAS7110040, partial [Sousa chinensis]